MEIIIAGAGAGKTTGLVKKIINKYNSETKKEIHCVSFTNASVNTISDKVKEYFGDIPQNIKISTIHSFLNKNIIYPYNYILYGIQFKSISSEKLDTRVKFKNNQLSRLKESGILHVEDFTMRAKCIICGYSGDRISQKTKRPVILSNLVDRIDTIFVDEMQDSDAKFLKIIERLDQIGIEVVLIGDPKQNLRGTKEVDEFIKKYEDTVIYKDECYRCPVKHVRLANSFINENEKQVAMNECDGTIRLYFESDIEDIGKFLKEEKYGLKYIYKKNEIFDTQKKNVSQESQVFDKVKYLMKKYRKLDGLRQKLWASCFYYDYQKNINNMSHKDLLNKLLERYIITRIEKGEYASLITAIQDESLKNNELSNFSVDSIARIKGLEADKCLFIITTDIAKYLTKERDGSRKMISHLYVGLTRSRGVLDLFITKKVEEMYGKEYIFECLKEYM